MSEEKDEKGRDEKGRDSGFGEKGSQDQLGRAVGGLILIWLGACFFMVTSGPWKWDSVWSYFLGGMGVIFLLEVALRLLLPSFRRPVMGRLILSLVLIAVGFGGLVGLETWWPLVLIIIGLTIVGGSLTRSRRL